MNAELKAQTNATHKKKEDLDSSRTKAGCYCFSAVSMHTGYMAAFFVRIL